MKPVDRVIQKIIYDSTAKKDKVMFARKMEELDNLIAEIRGHEEAISKLMAAKQPLIDKLLTLRQAMVKICVHPKEFLEIEEQHVHCKFCGKKLQVNVRQAEKEA